MHIEQSPGETKFASKAEKCKSLFALARARTECLESIDIFVTSEIEARKGTRNKEREREREDKNYRGIQWSRLFISIH